MVSPGYQDRQGDHILIFKHSQGGKLAVLVYVDDFIITRDDPIKRQILKQKFVVKI